MEYEVVFYDTVFLCLTLTFLNPPKSTRQDDFVGFGRLRAQPLLLYMGPEAP